MSTAQRADVEPLAEGNRASTSDGLPGAPDTSPSLLGDDRVDVLYEEQGLVRTEWLPVERVRVSKRVITEIQTIEVEVRREELVVEQTDALVSTQVFPIGRAPLAPEPIVRVLHREVPYIHVEVEPYEQVTVRVVQVESETPVSLALQAERSRVAVTESPSSLSFPGETNRRQE